MNTAILKLPLRLTPIVTELLPTRNTNHLYPLLKERRHPNMATLAERYTFPHEDTDTCSQCLKTFPFELFLIERNGRVSKMAYCTLCFQRIQTTGQKRCKDCGRTQPLKNFAASPSSSDEHRHSCYGCAGKSSAPSTKSEGAKVV